MCAKKWTEADVPDQSGRVAVVTGANTGLGLENARALAAKGATVVLAVRNLDKGKSAVAKIKSTVPRADVRVQPLDLASLTSVREAAEGLRDDYDSIDILINNAGLMYTPRSTTEDGFELQIGVNHLGHFALTGLLLDRLLAADSARIVSVASIAHKIMSEIDFDNLQSERSYNRVAAYGRSKLANLLFTYELQRRLAAADSNAVALAAHPGVASTELARNSPFYIKAFELLYRPVLQSPKMGALATLRAATDEAAVGGQYYGPSGLGEVSGLPKIVSSTKRSHDVTLQRKMWAVSEELTGVSFEI